MGWYFELNVKCSILPEFVEFIKQKYLFKINNKSLTYLSFPIEEIEAEENKQKSIYDGLSKLYKDLIDIWIDLDICRFYNYEFDESTCIFTCKIRKKVTSHDTGSHLWDDYELFLKDIIVPISSFIHACNIESDDYGDRIQIYTDMELRGQRFTLNDMIKSIAHISEDGMIVGTNIIYKRSVNPTQIIDLNHCFGK